MGLLSGIKTMWENLNKSNTGITHISTKIKISDASSRLTELRVGNFCVLQNCTHTKKNIEVQFKGQCIGLLPKWITPTIRGEMVCNHVIACIVTRINKGIPIITIYYKTQYGIDAEPNFESNEYWEVIETEKYNGELDTNFMPVNFTLEIIDRHLEFYGVNSLPTHDLNTMGKVAEDDRIIERFIMQLYCGTIIDQRDVRDFMNQHAEMRQFGTNNILKKRINKYLAAKNWYLEV